MSDEEKNRNPGEEPEIEDTGETPNRGEDKVEDQVEPVEEAQGSPGDPASIEEVPPEAEESSEEETTRQKLEAFEEELELARKERDEYLDSLRRLKAEFENSRKRQEREKERIFQMASEDLVKELLPVLDNLERALESEGDIREGVRATRDQLLSVLEKEGLISVASDGQHFDPTVHEAVMSQPSEEHEEGTIVQTFQRGYVLNGKPIRPAKVVVARQV